MIDLPKKIDLSALVLSDPLTKETEAKRTQLMFTACASILLTAYGLKINKTPWLDIEVPVGAPNILHGALSVALIYTTAIFIFHAYTDLARWWISREIVSLNGYHNFLINLHNHLSAISNGLKKSSSTPTDETRKASAAHATAEAQIESLNKELRRLQTRHSTLTIAQFFRISIIDISIPLILAAVAMTKISAAFWPFLSAIVR